MPYLRIMPGTQCQQGQYWYPVYLCSPYMGLPPGVFPTSGKYFKLQKLSACQGYSFNNDSSRLFNNFIKTVLSLDGNGNRSCITMQYMTMETYHGKKEKFHKHEFVFAWITQEGVTSKKLYFDKKVICGMINIAIISANTYRKQSYILLFSISSCKY